MSKHVPPPTGIPVAGPELTQDSLAARLATQAAEREEALQRLRSLRKEAAAEIDRLIGFLDKTDDYVCRELEDAVDDNPCDDLETEPSLGWTDSEAKAGRYSDPWNVDAELDESDDEPSLGSGAVGVHSTQSQWAQGRSDDVEDANEDGDGSMANGTVDDEPSLGSTATINQEAWAFGNNVDREQGTTRRFRQEPKPASICNVTPVSGEWWKLEKVD